MESEVKDQPKKTHQGRAIRRLRSDMGLTQKELGDLVGITQQNVGRHEKEEKLDDEILKQYAKGFGVSVDFIKKLEDKPMAQIVYNDTYNFEGDQQTNNVNNGGLGNDNTNNIGIDKASLQTILNHVEDLCKKSLDQYNDLINSYIEILHACKPEANKEDKGQS